MIRHLTFIFLLLCSLCLFSSCTIFGGSEEGTEEEEYYGEEGEEGEGEDDASEQDDSEEGEEEDEEEGEEDYDDEEDSDDYDEEDEEDNEGYDDDYDDEDEEDYDEEDEEEGEEDEYAGMDEYPSEASPQGGTPESMTQADGSVAPKQWISYKKIKTAPYRTGGVLVNAVYIARPDEDIQSISQKIYGSDQTSALYTINPHLKSRSVKVGDKIYYSSPRRPQDSSRLLVYFEDAGVQPNYHQVKAGENIRQVAQKLLGHPNSWKEIWGTNPDLESKGVLNQDANIRYWPPGVGPTELQPVPEEEPAGQEEPAEMAEDEEQSGDMDENTADDEELDSPPPPPSDSDFPEESSTDEGPGMEGASEEGGGSSQTNMIVAGLLALIALICGFAVMKKKWRKKTDFDYTAVNYEVNE